MNQPIIRVKNIGKKYQINHRLGGYVALRDILTNIVKSPFRFVRHKIGLEKDEEFWALKNVSFEINKGEVVGIIGANGAGKSTLLKILSQITPPTEGEIILQGRVGSILEVGTGFHPELTGRENIFLNGAILGMKRGEIEKKFDNIAKFSGVEKFLDTPVKHYSSGMYVRLAFSVAAHMDSDILIIDEVLAVGDAEFQKKCLGKMEEITKTQGRTIIFVSHNMTAVSRICDRTILIRKGEIVKDGPTKAVVEAYTSSGLGPTAEKEWKSSAPGNNIVRLGAVRIKQNDKVTGTIDIRDPIDIEMEYEVTLPGHVLYPNFHFYNEEGICVFVAADYEKEWRGRERLVGRYLTTAKIPGNLLSEGMIRVVAAMSTIKPLTVHFDEKDVVAFNVVDSFEGDSARGDFSGKIPGVIRPLLHWTTKFSKH